MVNIANPYCGTIDSDDAGNKKMICKMMREFDNEDKFDFTQKYISDFRDQVDEAAYTFYFGSVLFTIPLSYDSSGMVVETEKLIEEPNVVMLEIILDFTGQVWGNTNGDYVINSGGTTETDTDVLQQRIRSSILGS